jgi:hypothetical protein
MPYHRLIVAVVLANACYACAAGWWFDHSPSLRAQAIIAQANLAVAIVARQQYVINAVCRMATRVPVTWPLKLRWAAAKVYHFGGVHVGAAVSGVLWHLVFVASLCSRTVRGHSGVPPANLVISVTLGGLFLAMLAMALPAVRARAHDGFEATHRFCGWAALLLVWANTTVFLAAQRGTAPASTALLHEPAIWMLVLTTACTALPWLRLRRLPLSVHRPSSHVAVISLDHGVTPFIGSVRPISRNPLLGWHTFANVPAPPHRATGYRMIVSRAGDWTTDFINNPPSHVWVRGIPTAGMANVRRLFGKVLYVATGSGIGPMLAHLMAAEVPARLLWVTRSPCRTYGAALVEEVLAAQPDTTIWNTDERGKPDMLGLTYSLYKSCAAEAVICIANRAVTRRVVHGLECLGIPAFGPIWDS